MGAADHAGPHLHFPDALLRHVDDSTKASRSFELLGAAIGSDDFIHQHSVERAARAGTFWMRYRKCQILKLAFREVAAALSSLDDRFPSGKIVALETALASTQHDLSHRLESAILDEHVAIFKFFFGVWKPNKIVDEDPTNPADDPAPLPAPSAVGDWHVVLHCEQYAVC